MMFHPGRHGSKDSCNQQSPRAVSSELQAARRETERIGLRVAHRQEAAGVLEYMQYMLYTHGLGVPSPLLHDMTQQILSSLA